MDGSRIAIVVQCLCTGPVLSQKGAKVTGHPGIMSKDNWSVRKSRIIADIAHNVKKHCEFLPVSIRPLNPVMVHLTTSGIMSSSTSFVD
jgi:hypothetical protein